MVLLVLLMLLRVRVLPPPVSLFVARRVCHVGSVARNVVSRGAGMYPAMLRVECVRSLQC